MDPRAMQSLDGQSLDGLSRLTRLSELELRSVSLSRVWGALLQLKGMTGLAHLRLQLPSNQLSDQVLQDCRDMPPWCSVDIVH